LNTWLLLAEVAADIQRVTVAVHLVVEAQVVLKLLQVLALPLEQVTL
jgi:hypothetical protein